MKILVFQLIIIINLFVPHSQATETKDNNKAVYEVMKKLYLEETKKERKGWKQAYEHYGEYCLKDLKAGQNVTREISMSSTECYVKHINIFVKPYSVSPKAIDNMTSQWLKIAKEYQNGEIDFNQYSRQLASTQEQYSKNSMRAFEELFHKAGRNIVRKNNSLKNKNFNE